MTTYDKAATAITVALFLVTLAFHGLKQARR